MTWGGVLHPHIELFVSRAKSLSSFLLLCSTPRDLMKRKQPSKSLQRRRRYSRVRKVKAAALSLGLVTAWGATADAATYNATATATITLSGSAYVSDGVGGSVAQTATITIEGINDVPSGQSASGSSSIPGDVDATSGYYYVGVSNGDLVLSFPGGGAAAIGEFWGALFFDSMGQGITEGQILDQLAVTPLRNGDPLDPASPLGILNRDYGHLLRTPYGEEATLVAFTNNAAGPNHGISGGTTTMTVVPEPATWAILATAAGITSIGVRRRE